MSENVSEKKKLAYQFYIGVCKSIVLNRSEIWLVDTGLKVAPLYYAEHLTYQTTTGLLYTSIVSLPHISSVKLHRVVLRRYFGICYSTFLSHLLITGNHFFSFIFSRFKVSYAFSCSISTVASKGFEPPCTLDAVWSQN